MPYVAITPLSVARGDSYTYQHPEVPAAGTVVKVSFGRKPVLGIVTGEALPIKTAAPIQEVSQVVLPAAQFAVARWIAEEYVAPFGIALKGLVDAAVLRYAPANPVVPAVQVRSVVPPPQLLTAADRRTAYRQLLTASAKHQSLVIVPERGDLQRLKDLYPELTLYHSGLTPKQRTTLWWRVASGEPITVLGTRSALLLPWTSLSALIVDEEDDLNHKQAQTPRWHARAVAHRLATATGATLAYGSSAPSLELLNQLGLTELPAETPPVQLVTPRRAHGDGIVSYELWQALESAVGLSLIYAPQKASEVLSSLQQSFAERTIPYDPSLIPTKNAIVVGDSEVLRRSDWPVQVSAVCGADRLLALPDFRASEKAAQIVIKAAALVKPSGQAFLQTAQSDHPAWLAATTSYRAFAEQELAERRMLGLPPAIRLTKLIPPPRGKAELPTDTLTAAGLQLQRRQEQGGRPYWLASGDPKPLRPLLTTGWSIDVDTTDVV